MTFELEISTMYKTKDECLKMLESMNIHCDCMIINQCDVEDFFEDIINGQHIRIFFTKERGLSKSRNMALKNCKADIIGIADDDLFYYDNFDKTIIESYEQNPKAGSIIFNMDSYNKIYPTKGFRCNFLRLFGFCSILCTFRMHNIQKVHKIGNKDLLFNEYFGTGSKHFQSGEENIFLADCYHAGVKIFYTPKKILKRPETESSWFHGIDEDFIETRGAIIYAMDKKNYVPLILLMAIKKVRAFKGFSFFQILNLMFKGVKKYKNILKFEN